MTDIERDSTPTTALTRRRLVKTGAHAVWVVPTVVLVTAAPSFAMSGILAVTNSTTKTDTNGLRVTGTVSNSDSEATSNFRLTVVVTGQYNISQSAVLTVPDGFTQTDPGTVSNNNHTYTVTFKANNQLGPNATINYTTTLAIGPDPSNVQDFSVTVTAEPGGAGVPGSATATV